MVHHPRATLHIDVEVLLVPGEADRRVLSRVPADPATDQFVDDLHHERGGHLRVVHTSS